MATWSRKPWTGMPQFLCFSDSHLRTVGWFFLRGCDVIPLCHFESCFEVLALCSHLPSFSGIWFLTSSVTDSGTAFASPCLLGYSLHTFSSDQPMSHNLFCTHLHSATSFLITLRCHASICISSQYRLDRLQPHSFLQLVMLLVCCPFLPTDHHHGLFQKHFLHILRADHYHVH